MDLEKLVVNYKKWPTGDYKPSYIYGRTLYGREIVDNNFSDFQYFINKEIKEKENMAYDFDWVKRTMNVKNYLTCTDELPEIKNVIFNPPATIVFWADGSKTVVKCMENREFDKWEGFSMAICKKLFGKKFKYTFKKWCGK